jgi:glycosyltransferase involved in cell wall biosynthesis
MLINGTRTTDSKLNVAASKVPAVSVIMPSFNAGATIEAAVRSVQGQTFTDLEIIIVDDGSTDNSSAVLRNLATGDRRIRVVYRNNAGPSAARNFGFEMARGRYLALLDADDLWSCNHLERHVGALQADPKIGVSFAACDIVDSSGQATGEFTRFCPEDLTCSELLGSNPTATCSSLVIRSEVINSAGPMCASMKYAEDQEWLFRIVHAGWAIRCIDERTVVYRTSAAGLSSNSANMLRGWEAFISSARKLAPDLVTRHLPKATADIHLYHARRALRTQQPGNIARTHIAAAIAASPRTAAKRPLHLAGLVIASIAPQLANTALKLACSVRHA